MSIHASPFELPYNRICEASTDISEHLPCLYDLARECGHVTEFGVRTGASTVSFLHALIPTGGVLQSYDINDDFDVNGRFRGFYNYLNWTFTLADTSKLGWIEDTDLLFLDTLHNYSQLVSELRHVESVRKYLVFHDTVTFGKRGDDGKEGIQLAIDELLTGCEWKMHRHYTNNNGLTVLKRRIQ